MTVPPLVQGAIEFLKSHRAQDVSRERLEAYARLSAWTHYFPSQRTRATDDLLSSNRWIEKVEFSRYLKQRRLAAALVCKEMREQRGFEPSPTSSG